MANDFRSRLKTSFRRAITFVDNAILETRTAERLSLPAISRRGRWIEWLFIALAITAYCLPFLRLGTRDRLPGNESQMFQSLDQVLQIGVAEEAALPRWNPYIRTGLPYVADPMLHAYNPFISLPVLLLGVDDGFKVAVYMGFLIAAFGGWFLARMLGLGSAGRVWTGLLYAFAGATMARFFQGQYLLTLAACWIPFAVGSVYAAARTRRRLHVCMAAISLALLFMCGNVYYAYYALFVLGILSVVMCLRLRARRPWIEASIPVLKTLLAIAVLAIGLIAIQLVPLVEFSPRIGKATNPGLSDSHTAQQVILDFTSTDHRRPDAIASLPPEEFYAFIGWLPIMAMVTVPLAWRKGRRGGVLFFMLLLAFTVLWSDIRDTPLREIYGHVRLLQQFRYPTRMLIFGTLAIVSLSGIGLDEVIRRLDAGLRKPLSGAVQFAGMVLKYGAFAFMLIALVVVARTNRKHLRLQNYYPPPEQVLGWLREHDSATYYISAPNGWHHAATGNKLRYLDAWYPLNDIRDQKGAMNKRPVQAAPKYVVLGNDAPPSQGAMLVQEFQDFSVFELPSSLPFAFSVATSELTAASPDGRPLQRETVQPVEAYTPTMHQIEFIVEGAPDRQLVVLSALAPGWRLTVDGRSSALSNVSGFMGAGLLAGTHRYVFSYRPGSFVVGAWITIVVLLAVMAMLISDLAFAPRPVRLSLSKLGQEIAARWRRGALTSLVNQRPSRGVTTASGPLRAKARRNLPVGSRGRTSTSRPGISAWGLWVQATAGLIDSWLARITWPALLLTIGLGVYLVVTLYRIADFPIYFFTDEAVHMNQAADLVRNGFRNSQHEFLPTYFSLGPMFSLNGVSVYLQLLPFLLFGKSVAVTRSVSALVTAAGALAVALTLKDVFRSRQYWLGALLLVATPAWFLHARTAFEYMELSSFYAIFIYCYLRYRRGERAYLLAAVAAGALTFYTHGLGQVLMGATGVLLLILDIRHHLRQENRRMLVYAFGLLVILALPYVRYQLAHPEVVEASLRQRGSFLLDPGLTALDKAARFITQYSQGINPLYWYIPHGRDLARHTMKGYGHISLAILPFALVGLYSLIRHISKPEYRALLVFLLVTPIPASLVGVGVTRVLWFIVPATIIGALGLEHVLHWIAGKAHVARPILDAAAFLALAGASILMLVDSLSNGPRWYANYTLYGMQYGAKQVFVDTVLRGLQDDPDTSFIISPNWTNGTDQLRQFFIPSQYQNRARLDSLDAYIDAKKELLAETVFIAIPDEYKRAQESPVLSDVQVLGTIPYPDGQPGFYLLHVAYATDADEVFARQEEARRQPMEAEIVVREQPASITFSRIEAGRPEDMFDGDVHTLVRGIEANPFLIDLAFGEPLSTSGLVADFGHMRMTMRVELYPVGQTAPLTYETQSLGEVGDPHVELQFPGGPYSVQRIRIEITNLNAGAGAPAKIHVREVRLQP